MFFYLPEKYFNCDVEWSYHGLMAVIAVINQKGGVAKTTTAINVASNWARMGKKVLLIDLDPQSSATKAIFGDQEFDVSIYDVLIGQVSMEDAVRHSNTFGIDVVPAEIMLSGIDIQLAAQIGREQVLRKKIDPIAKDYDAVLIDCSPSLGLLTVNALMASKDIVIPICPEYFSMKGIELILETLKNIRAGLGYMVGIRGIVITRYKNRKIVKEVLEDVQNRYGIKVFETFIPDSILVEEAHHEHMPVLEYAPNCQASKAYSELSRELWQ